jgi:hypothetical protein
MRRSRPRQHYNPRDLAAEIVRRAPSGAVVRLSEPPTPLERLQLIAAQLHGTPFVIMPHPCKTAEEWEEQCAAAGLRIRQVNPPIAKGPGVQPGPLLSTFSNCAELPQRH